MKRKWSQSPSTPNDVTVGANQSGGVPKLEKVFSRKTSHKFHIKSLAPKTHSSPPPPTWKPVIVGGDLQGSKWAQCACLADAITGWKDAVGLVNGGSIGTSMTSNNTCTTSQIFRQRRPWRHMRWWLWYMSSSGQALSTVHESLGSLGMEEAPNSQKMTYPVAKSPGRISEWI